MLEEYLRFLSQPDWLLIVYVIAPLAVSVVFFLKDKNKNKFIHFAVTVHGAMVTFVLLFSQVVLSLGWSGENWRIFLNIMAIAVISSIIFSIFRFTGDKRWHLLHIITITVSPYLWFLSTMAYTNRWL